MQQSSRSESLRAIRLYVWFRRALIAVIAAGFMTLAASCSSAPEPKPDSRPEAIPPIFDSGGDPEDKEVTINIVPADAEAGKAWTPYMAGSGALDVDGLTKKFMAELAAYPQESYPEMWEEDPSAPGQMISRLKVLIRCDERVDSGRVQQVLKACQNVGIHRIRFAALSERSGSPSVVADEFRLEGSMQTPLPRNEGGALVRRTPDAKSCRVYIIRNATHRVVIFMDDTENVAPSRAETHRTSYEQARGLPAGPEMEWVKNYIVKRQQLKPDLALVVDFSPNVPWKYVNDVIDVSKSLKIQDIAFVQSETRIK